MSDFHQRFLLLLSISSSISILSILYIRSITAQLPAKPPARRTRFLKLLPSSHQLPVKFSRISMNIIRGPIAAANFMKVTRIFFPWNRPALFRTIIRSTISPTENAAELANASPVTRNNFVQHTLYEVIREKHTHRQARVCHQFAGCDGLFR